MARIPVYSVATAARRLRPSAARSYHLDRRAGARLEGWICSTLAATPKWEGGFYCLCVQLEGGTWATMTASLAMKAAKAGEHGLSWCEEGV